MQTKVREMGNSLGLLVPAHLAKELRMQAGQSVEIDPEGKKLSIVPSRRPRYERNALLAQCDLTAPEAEDMQDWQATAPVGREGWSCC